MKAFQMALVIALFCSLPALAQEKGGHEDGGARPSFNGGKIPTRGPAPTPRGNTTPQHNASPENRAPQAEHNAAPEIRRPRRTTGRNSHRPLATFAINRAIRTRRT